jgi:hypothetical protein
MPCANRHSVVADLVPARTHQASKSCAIARILGGSKRSVKAVAHSSKFVMPGLVPRIHVFSGNSMQEDVDGRDDARP